VWPADSSKLHQFHIGGVVFDDRTVAMSDDRVAADLPADFGRKAGTVELGLFQ